MIEAVQCARKRTARGLEFLHLFAALEKDRKLLAAGPNAPGIGLDCQTKETKPALNGAS